jgi:hypothetical protein
MVVRGLIIEGVTASGKTTLMKALQRVLLERRPAATKLVLSEHYTDRLLEEPRRRGEMALGDALGLLEDAILGVRALAKLEAGGKFAGRGGDAGVYVLIERFVGSHVAYLARHGVAPSAAEHARIAALYEELAAIGVRTVVLRVPDAVLPGAVLATRTHRSPAWRGFLASHGDDDAIIASFTAWQGALLAFYASLPGRVEIVDVARPGHPGDAAALAERLLGTLER